jgi:hypothetical protein
MWYNIFRMNAHHIHLKIQRFEPTGQRNNVCLIEHTGVLTLSQCEVVMEFEQF